MSKTYQIELTKITTEGLQTRAALNLATVKEYASAVSDLGAVFPPVTVFLGPDGVYRLADGFHRLEVARRQGHKTIAAEVREGGFIDALKVALLANAAHGLRRTAADKRNAVMIAYKYRLELGLGEVPSANSVARTLGVSDHFAGLHLSTVRTWRESQARTGTDGKTYSLQSNASDLRLPPSGHSLPAVLRPLDQLGREVPPALQPLWDRGAEVGALCDKVARVQTVLRTAQDRNDPLWCEVDFVSALDSADKLLQNIKQAEPYCVCPLCKGVGCMTCCERGFLSERRYIKSQDTLT